MALMMAKPLVTVASQVPRLFLSDDAIDVGNPGRVIGKLAEPKSGGTGGPTGTTYAPQEVAPSRCLEHS